MNYYIFCYRSSSGQPNLTEAQQTIEQYETKGKPRTLLPELIQKLKEHFPSMVHSWAESPVVLHNPVGGDAKQFQHTLLKTEDNGHGLQFNIYQDNISIEIPYLSSSIRAEEAIDRVIIYIGIICKLTGYLAYDPQTGQVYNPLLSCFGGLKTYCAMGRETMM